MHPTRAAVLQAVGSQPLQAGQGRLGELTKLLAHPLLPAPVPLDACQHVLDVAQLLAAHLRAIQEWILSGTGLGLG